MNNHHLREDFWHFCRFLCKSMERLDEMTIRDSTKRMDDGCFKFGI